MSKYSTLSRVGINVIDSEDIRRYSEKISFGWYKDFCLFGDERKNSLAANYVFGDKGKNLDIEYVPILPHQSKNNKPLKKKQIKHFLDWGGIDLLVIEDEQDFKEKVFFEDLEKRLSSLPPPDKTLFLVGVEPGYKPNNDSRSPKQIVEDAKILKSIIKNENSSYRIGLGGISTGRNKTNWLAYGFKHGFDVWKKILELSPSNLFDTFTIHPYPTNFKKPIIEDLKNQVYESRKLLSDFGMGEKDLIVGETGIPFKGADEKEIMDYSKEAIRFYLTASDSKSGNPDDSNLLVQRFCWFMLNPPRFSIPGFTNNPVLDLDKSVLFNHEGNITELGEVFKDTVGEFL
jgi:hypothetical protein